MKNYEKKYSKEQTDLIEIGFFVFFNGMNELLKYDDENGTNYSQICKCYLLDYDDNGDVFVSFMDGDKEIVRHTHKTRFQEFIPLRLQEY